MTQIPHSIGIIMDGNRRWAKARGLPTIQGHSAGYEKLREVAQWCRASGIRALTVYAFSTENWKRGADEVDYLMELFHTIAVSIVDEARAQDTRLLFIGERTRLDPRLQEALANAELQTAACRSLTLAIAISYGGRAEIIDAIHRIPPEELVTISESDLSSLLWTKDIPDPDLIIRTSGEERLSNFLPWQSVYSELHFTKTLWPDLTQEEFNDIIHAYHGRERRIGV